MFKINDREIIQLEKDLKTFAIRAFPFATKNTINKAAFHTRNLSMNHIEKNLILRNKWTKNSVKVTQSKTLYVKKQTAIVGSIADYMADQEFGTTKVKTGKQGVSIPTSYSAGQGEAQPRTRLPRKANKMANIQLHGRRQRKAKTRKQQVLFTVQDAVESGNKYAFIDLGKRQGIFKIIGGRKGFKRGWPKGARLKMVHDLSKQTVTIPARPWLMPNVLKTIRHIPSFYKKALKFQLKRHNLFN